MNKKIVINSLITLALVSGSLMATNFHAPLPSGPLRYDFEKVQKNKSTFNFWSTGYMREADKVYMKHGFNTKPYTTLIFGKSEFKIAEAFEGGIAKDWGYTEKRNPYLRVTTFAPRASYSERGIVLGGQLAYPVWSNKGRVGVRGSIPLRSVRVEKDDEMEHAAVGTQKFVIKGEAKSTVFGPEAGGGGDAKTLSGISSYNVNFLRDVKGLASDGNVVPMFYVNGNNRISIAGHDYNLNLNQAGLDAQKIPFVLIKSQFSDLPPYGQGGAVLIDTANNVFLPQPAANGFVCYTARNVDTGGSMQLPKAPNVGALNVTHAYIPCNDNADNYSPYKDNPTTTSDLWITTIHGSGGQPIDVSASDVAKIDSALAFYNQDVTTFLANNSFVFQTYSLTGLGDTDLDLFYNHNICDHWNGELYAGVKVPTGAGDKYYGNPYKQYLGNGNHFELKVGGKVAWDTCNWLNVKADAHYNFVLEAVEHRMAAFKDATIKNLGPKADADVSWGYFTGDVDVTLYHPKTRDLATTIGYELYYKTEDRITYKAKDMTGHWLGKQWNNALPGTDKWQTFVMNLSNSLARKNTESIGHRAYIEGSYVFSKYFSMSCGGKYTFAGQNIPCEGEAYTGFNVKF